MYFSFEMISENKDQYLETFCENMAKMGEFIEFLLHNRKIDGAPIYILQLASYFRELISQLAATFEQPANH